MPGEYLQPGNSSLDYDDRKKIETDLKIIVSGCCSCPGKMHSDGFPDLLKKAPVCLFAIDEAHCISEWGHNFRPEYRQLSALKKRFPSVPDRTDRHCHTCRKKRHLPAVGLSEPREYIGSFNRKNLQYRVLPKKDALDTLLAYVRQHRDDSGIVYSLSKKETEDLAERLRKSGFPARAYHAGLSKRSGRMSRMNSFMIT